MVNYHAGSLALPAPGRQISGYPPASGSRTTLTRIPPCRLFLVASSLSPLPCRLFLVASLGALLFAGRPRFRLAGSLTADESMKNLLTQWELRRKTDPKLGASSWLLRGRAVGARANVDWDHRSSSHQRLRPS